jgi:diphosphomevalonate decarboxylase
MSELKKFVSAVARPFQTAWRSPSNIAFVKYWGKIGHQIPANPSVSMTLRNCYTETKLTITENDSLALELFLDEKKEDKFGLKIQTYLEKLAPELPVLKSLKFVVETKNTFPHGTGIASSASGLSAFALGLSDYLYAATGVERDESFTQTASYLSRLASGSACRSVYGGFASWGDVSNEFASPFEVHPSIRNLQDTVLVVSGEEKKVSSRAGHEQMKEHGFAEARFAQAKKNYVRMSGALRSGDLEEMGSVLENEALQLHAMMLTSPDSYTLLRPNTLAAIEAVRDFRHETKIPLYFTLDAGPNLHLIYPTSVTSKVSAFVRSELTSLSETFIVDECGDGPEKLV